METYLLPIILALMALGLLGAFTVGVLWGRRSAPGKGKSGEKQQAGPPSMDLPPALIGARYREILEHFAPILGVAPGNLLRAARVLSRAADWADSVATPPAPAGDVQGKVLPFRKREAPRASKPIEDPPSGEYDHIETLADVIRLTAHTLPTDSREAIIRVIASLCREDPNADMDTDSGPLWVETISHFLPGNPYVTMSEVTAEYNRRAEEHNRLLDEEEARTLADAPLTPTLVSSVATPHPKTEKS